GAARIALAAGAAAQLVVDAPALMALGADDEEAAGCKYFLPVALDLGANLLFAARALSARWDTLELGCDAHLGIAAALEVVAARGQVGGDGDRTGLAGLGYDLRLLLVIARVEHVVRHVQVLQK